MAPQEENYDVNDYSYVVDISQYDVQGFCAGGYELRRSKPDAEAYCTAGTEDLKQDWIKYIGPVDEFGSRNDLYGHWCALSLPLIIPERQYLVSYIFEYAFYHDTILESVAKAVAAEESSTLFMDNTASRSKRAIQGAKQLQSKIFHGFIDGDKERVARIVRTWGKMTSTTAKREKTHIFPNITEYEEYRMVDTGAFYVEAVMLWGMAMTLTDEEDAAVEHIRRPVYAALGLTNDVFSFDVEYEGWKKSDGGSLTNAVWLYMQWDQCTVEEAKEKTRIEVNRLERLFLQLMNEYIEGPGQENPKMVHYLRALSYQIPGNLVWSLNCPRYHPSYRNCGPLPPMLRPAGLGPDVVEKKVAPTQASSDTNSEGSISPASSHTSLDSMSRSEGNAKAVRRRARAQRTLLSAEHALAPVSKSVDAASNKALGDLTDALCIWLDASKEDVDTVKSVATSVNTTTRMLDASQAIVAANAAAYANLQSLDAVRTLREPSASVDIFIQELKSLQVGQSYDLEWLSTGAVPTEEEYLDMIDHKAGALPRMIARLLIANDVNTSSSQIEERYESLVTWFARYVEVFGDLLKIKAAKSPSADEKDISLTRLSLPLVHALNTTAHKEHIQSHIQQVQSEGAFTLKSRMQLLKMLDQAGSIAYTRQILGALAELIEAKIVQVETTTGIKNWPMKLLLMKIKV